MIAENSNNTILLGHEKELLDVIADYARSWKILGQFDEDKIEVKKFKKTKFQLNYYKCRDIIDGLKEDLIAKKLVGDLFGQEISARLEGILGNLYQTYGGEELYPSIEEKAAHLLYFVIKDHPFFDGNKRIGSLLFLYFLEKNSFLFKENGVTKISDKTIVALALLVASSNPKEKDLLVSLIINLIQD
jgi:prophage maintenance system killer protein